MNLKQLINVPLTRAQIITLTLALEERRGAPNLPRSEYVELREIELALRSAEIAGIAVEQPELVPA